MAEYIGKETIQKAITSVCEECREDCEEFDGIYPDCNQCPVDGFKKGLGEVPAADVAPVRHGRYIGEYDGYADGNPVYDMWHCSECGCYFEEWDEKPTHNYCPNCGADMRGEE